MVDPKHIAITVTAVIVLLVGVNACYAYGTDFERVITVERLYQRVQSNEDATSHVYMVADAEGNSYEVVDSFLYWQFRSADVWNRMKEGERYRIHAFGWRIGWLSEFPKIIEAEAVTP